MKASCGHAELSLARFYLRRRRAASPARASRLGNSGAGGNCYAPGCCQGDVVKLLGAAIGPYIVVDTLVEHGVVEVLHHVGGGSIAHRQGELAAQVCAGFVHILHELQGNSHSRIFKLFDVFKLVTASAML